MVTYRIVEETLLGDDLEYYQSYGIVALNEDGGQVNPIDYVSDVFLSKETAGRFVQMCNQLKLDFTHFRDAIDDAVAGAV